jgi:dTDP-4-dehydrorhamnose reductase
VKILLLGADGQVGFELHRALAPLGTVVPATLEGRLPGGAACVRCDLADRAALAALVAEAAPAWIVNAAAYTAVDKAEDEVERAARVNAGALEVLGAEAVRRGAAVLHYSTDYVFPGNGARPYREDDPTAPVNVYGQTKLDGELALRDSGARHLVFRTAWVYGARGHNFLLTMLKLAKSRDKLTVVDDQQGTPTPARLLAAVSALAIARLEAARDDALYGTYHVTSAGSTTWHGFASEIVRLALDAGLLRRPIAVEPIPSSAFPTRARRPAYSVLDCARVERAFGVHLPGWRPGLAGVVGELAELAAHPLIS